MTRLLLSLIGALMLSLPVDGWAQPMRERPALTVFFAPEVATSRFFGDAQSQTSWSFGGHLRQGLGYGPVIAWLRVGGDAWLTYQPGPPLQRGLRSFNTGVGLGFQHEVSVLRFTVFGEYDLINISGNPLPTILGPKTRYHAVGGGAAAAFTALSPLFVELRASALHWFGTASPTQSLQIFLSIGIEAKIRR